MSLENELAYERDIRELREENARLTQRVEELEGESRVLIGCPCWCHTGDGPEPHGDCRECVRGTSTPTRIERDHTEALWQEKWKAALDLMASQAERAEAAEAKLARCVEALAFYADTRRYQGSNQPYRDGDDSFTPPGSPYLIDMHRDGGSIARVALAAAKGE